MKKHESAYGVGIISIFLIFAVLCLTVFATLAVSSARADLRLSEKNADYVKSYYAATAECAAFVRQAEAACGDTLTAVSPGIVENGRVSYDMTFAIDENSRLHAAFYIAADGGCQYTVFEVESEYADVSDGSLDVWQP